MSDKLHPNDTVIMREIRITVRVDDQLPDNIQRELLELFDELTATALMTLMQMVNITEPRLIIDLSVEV